jgi:hypothetical protein
VVGLRLSISQTLGEQVNKTDNEHQPNAKADGTVPSLGDRHRHHATIVYRASTRDCGPCALKLKCTPNMTFRKIPREVHEDARDATRALMGTPEFVKSRSRCALRT